MPLERKVFVKGQDLDTVLEYIEVGAFREGRNIHVGVSDTGNAGTVENLKGNTAITSTNQAQVEIALGVAPGTLSQGTFKVIGAREDITTSKVYYFVKNTNPSGLDFDRILEYSWVTGQILFVAVTSILDFSVDFLVTGINVVDGQLLYWTENNTSPKKLNIQRAKNTMANGIGTTDAYQIFDQEVIEAIKYPPLFPPSLTVFTDTTKLKNNLINKNVQFKYFYFKDDAEESCCSPISEISIAQGSEFIDQTVSYLPSLSQVNNAIAIQLATGHPITKKIGILVRFGNTGDFFLVDTLDKEVLNIPSFSIYTYNFYNDKLLSGYDLRKSNQLFDNVPRLAKAQEYIDGNRITYGNVFEGYDNPKDLNVSITPRYTDITASATFQWTSTRITHNVNNELYIEFTFPSQASSPSYSPEVGDIIVFTDGTFFNDAPMPILPYVVTQDDVTGYPTTLIQNILLANPTIAGLQLTTVITPTVGPPIYPATAYGIFMHYSQGGNPNLNIYRPVNKLGSFKSGAVHPFGLVYYDFANRSGTTVRNELFDAYTNFLPQQRPLTGDYIQRIGMDWAIYHQPPDWATHYQWVYTGNTTVSRFVQFVINGIATATNGTATELDLAPIVAYNENNPTDTIISYSFTKGDRVRFITDASHDAYGTYLDVEVLNFGVTASTTSTATTLTCQLVSSSGITIAAGTLVEIYTPELQETEKIYYEFGQAYQVLNAGLSNRSHQGETQNQSGTFINGVSTIPATGTFTRGDVWIRPRRMYVAAFALNVPPYWVDDYVEDFNISDFYASANWDKGRPNRVTETNQAINGSDEFRALRRPTTIPFSDVYIPETNINGLSRFFDFNFESYDNNFGSIQRLFSDDRILECYQELKVGIIPIQTKLSTDGSNNVITYQTDQILNEIRYYEGDFGIGLNPESFASYENQRYFCDVARGFVLRKDKNGISPVSKVYKIHSFITNLFRSISQYNGRVNIYGVFNRSFARYEFATETIPNGTTPSFQDWTRAFVDDSNQKGWVGYMDYHPETMIEFDQDIISFKNGVLYTHNTNPVYGEFYGTQYPAEIWTVANAKPEIVKTFLAMSQETNSPFSCYEITNNLNQQSELLDTDFEYDIGVYKASFLKDTNTPNVTNPLIEGDTLSDCLLFIKMRNSSTSYVRLMAINVKAIPSMLTP